MREKIHPKYVDCKVTCGCGTTFMTRSTQPEIRVEICSACHPFYTGKQRFVDSAGRVEKFKKRFSEESTQTQLAKSKENKKRRVKKEKVLVGGPRIKRRPIEEEPPAKRESKPAAEGAAPAEAPKPKPPANPDHAVRRRS